MVTVEVLTGVQRRRRWSVEQKKAMVLECEQPGMNVSVVARKYEVHPNQLFRFLSNGSRQYEKRKEAASVLQPGIQRDG